MDHLQFQQTIPMYEVHVLVTVRDKDENLIAVTESNNARYLPSEFTEDMVETV